MFKTQKPVSTVGSMFAMMELIFHATVRNLRKSHGNAIWGLAQSVIQLVLMISTFLIMANLLGMRSHAIRGDYILYLMSGIFPYMTHAKAIGAVSRAEGPTSSMMKHGPMNTAVSISAASLAALYQQVFSGAVVLYCYHVIWSPITIHDPVGLLGQLVLAWLSGIAIGLIFKGLIPWQPEAFGLLCSVYQRIDVIASGKMFVANQLSAQKLFYFDWNPLFHIIDQARGDIFLNYHPHFSSTFYAIKVSVACALVGLMAEFYTRKYVSVSWGMGR